MQRGIPAQYADSTEVLYGLVPGLKNSALVLSTRSGETVEVVRLAERAREAGIPIIAVTNATESAAARLADVTLCTYSRWDELVVISAYGGLMATNLCLAAARAGNLEGMLDDLRRTAGAAGPTLEETLELRDDLTGTFADICPIYLLGRGPSIASTLGGELVLEETARRPAIGMAAGLFRQGPIEVVGPQFGAIVFGGTGERATLNRSLTASLRSAGAHVLWVGAGSEGRPSVILPDLRDYTLPLLEIMPCHVLAHDLAARAGIQPGTVQYIERVITSEEGFPVST